MGPVIDHVCWLVPDGQVTADALRREQGLGSERGMYYPRAGTQHWFVPLEPPAGLELLEVVDREAAHTGDAGAQVLACEARGFGLFSWAVLVEDLDAVAARLGLPVDDYTLPQPDGTLRGWRTVSGPWHLPFFIDYPRNGDRSGRLREMYARVDHRCAPSAFTSLEVEADVAELDAWLGPHDLPLRVRPGTRGLVAATIATSRGEVTVP
jgi:hypothetical protein